MSATPVNLVTPTARVYCTYSWNAMPPHPGTSLWTRFVCLSDNHLRTDIDVPDGDVLIHCGDLTRRGGLHELKTTMPWIAAMPHKLKIVIAGNHDISLDPAVLATLTKKQASRLGDEWKQAPEYMRSDELTSRGVVYLQHATAQVEVEGRVWRIHGDPVRPQCVPAGQLPHMILRAHPVTECQPSNTMRNQAKVRVCVRQSMRHWVAWEGKKAHARVRWLVSGQYSQVPSRTEILVTHGPPKGTLDVTLSDVHAGCAQLATRVSELPALRLHVFGHVHEAFGAALHEETGLLSVNCAVKWQGQPVIVDLCNR
ncbi:Metallo-dependent phosphatase-like protein [Auriculariales sp. MPI-PUGE-AT-0066]|nr:Metallo-dependent phosphatase-like protein [Auriculariales sp. MPI-PUGE-AT-0066]